MWNGWIGTYPRDVWCVCTYHHLPCPPLDHCGLRCNGGDNTMMTRVLREGDDHQHYITINTSIKCDYLIKAILLNIGVILILKSKYIQYFDKTWSCDIVSSLYEKQGWTKRFRDMKTSASDQPVVGNWAVTIWAGFYHHLPERSDWWSSKAHFLFNLRPTSRVSSTYWHDRLASFLHIFSCCCFPHIVIFICLEPPRFWRLVSKQTPTHSTLSWIV